MNGSPIAVCENGHHQKAFYAGRMNEIDEWFVKSKYGLIHCDTCGAKVKCGVSEVIDEYLAKLLESLKV